MLTNISSNKDLIKNLGNKKHLLELKIKWSSDNENIKQNYIIF